MNNITTIVQLVFGSLRASWWRTVLTLLGIVISVAAIIVVITLGESVRQYVLSQVEAYGADTIQVEIKVPSADHLSTSNAAGIAMGVQITTLTSDDARAIAKLPGVKVITEGLMGQGVVSARGESVTALIMGTSPAMPEVDTQFEIAQGAFFDIAHERAAARVAVLGSEVVEDLFGNAQAIGEKIKIKGQIFRVVGVLAERGAMLGMSLDEMVYLPTHTLQTKVMGVEHIQYVTVKVANPEQVDDIAQSIITVLQMRHGTSGDDDDFGVTTMKEMIGTMESVFTSVTALLILLSAISLLVGGVGIMNVMLVAVAERVREIGLRKALGATRRDIAGQFLVEAVIISVLGALVGVALGALVVWGVSVVIASKGLEVAVAFGWFAPTIGVGFSVIAGVLFGLIPARRAGKISPMEAIRK